MISSGAVELPRTGQTSCYDAYGSSIACVGTGHDGATLAGVPLVSPRFTNHGNGTVTDHMTGLMWSQNANLPASTKTWQQALDYVAGMNAGTYANFGYTDWRLPNVVESLSLVNHENSSPAITSGHPFSNIQTGSTYYHTSTTTFAGCASSPNGCLWIVQFQTGGIGSSSKAGTRYVWPVRGGSGGKIALQKTGQATGYAAGDDGALQMGIAPPASRFINHGNGTVTDRFTGLMWTENSSLSGGTWQQVLDYVANMNTGSNANFGYTDWRLPNIVDLRSLLYIGNLNPALSTGHPFTNTTGSRWSSTSAVSTPTKAWSSNVAAGYKAAENKSASRNVWPVRSLLAMKLPLPGGKNWRLNTQTGGATSCGIPGPDQYHTGNGYYSLDFGQYSQENGLELNIPVYATAEGAINTTLTGWSDSFGWTVVIDHPGGYQTRYAHLADQPLVSSGSVTQGQQLGIMGTTPGHPYSTGVHLHFQVYYNNTSAQTEARLGEVLMEGRTLEEYTVGCTLHYLSTNTQ